MDREFAISNLLWFAVSLINVNVAGIANKLVKTVIGSNTTPILHILLLVVRILNVHGKKKPRLAKIKNAANTLLIIGVIKVQYIFIRECFLFAGTIDVVRMRIRNFPYKTSFHVRWMLTFIYKTWLQVTQPPFVRMPGFIIIIPPTQRISYGNDDYPYNVNNSQAKSITSHGWQLQYPIR